MKFLNEFLKRIIILLVLYSISRIYLFYNNFDDFYPVKILEFLEGIRIGGNKFFSGVVGGTAGGLNKITHNLGSVAATVRNRFIFISLKIL